MKIKKYEKTNVGACQSQRKSQCDMNGIEVFVRSGIGGGKKFILNKTKAIRRSINAGMTFEVDKVFIFNWTKHSFIVFHYNQRTVIGFGCLRRRRLIKYSSPSTERGLMTVFYVLDNDHCYGYTNDRSSWKLLLLIL